MSEGQVVEGETVVIEPTMDEVAAIGTETLVPEATTEPVKVEVTEGDSPAPVETPSEPAQDAVQKRINKITAEKYEQKRRADDLQARLDAQVAPAQATPTDAPKLEDFDYDDEQFQSASIQYQVNKALASQQDTVVQQHAEQSRQAVVNEFTNKEAEYIGEHPEYADEITNLPVFQEGTLNAIYELGPKVSHYLAKHLDIASEVANASPTMAAVRLGQISMGLTADTKQVKPTTAPEPVATIAGGGTISKSQDEMSMDEIMRLP